MKTPNAKLQTPEKLQVPSSNLPRSRGGFEIWSFFGVRCLLFGVWVVAAITLALGVGANTTSGAAVQNWPRFRGPNGSGVSESRDLPVQFGPKQILTGRTAVPAGPASPVVWQHRVSPARLQRSAGA